MDSQQRVVITAGANGIGLAIARAFAVAGARVHICDIDANALAAAQEAHESISGTVCDVADRNAVQRFVDTAVDTLGGIDVLVNNAGIAGPTAPVEEIDPDAWDTVLAVNLGGTFNVTRLAVPYLRRSPSGVILVMSSIAGRFGYGLRSPYSVTKWGLVGFTKSLSLELGQYGIRVNTILPGAVEGPRIQRVFEARAQETGKSIEAVRAEAMTNQSIKGLVDPDEIAALALFLASDDARSISGQMFPIDNDSKAAQ